MNRSYTYYSGIIKTSSRAAPTAKTDIFIFIIFPFVNHFKDSPARMPLRQCVDNLYREAIFRLSDILARKIKGLKTNLISPVLRSFLSDTQQTQTPGTQEPQSHRKKPPAIIIPALTGFGSGPKTKNRITLYGYMQLGFLKRRPVAFRPRLATGVAI